MRRDLVLHLHCLDDAQHLPHFDLLTVQDLYVEHGSLHRADDRAAAYRTARAGCGALLASLRQRRVRRTPREEANVEAAAVELDREAPFDRRPVVPHGHSVGRMLTTSSLPRERLGFDDTVTRRARNEA